MGSRLILRCLGNLDFYITSISLIAMTIVAIAGVFFRFVLNDPLMWGDEVVKLIFAWFCFAGMSVIAKFSLHLRVDLIDYFLGPRSRIAVRLFSNLFVLGTAFLLLGYGILLCITQLGNEFASIPISRSWSFAALPVGAVLLATQLVPLIMADLKSLREAEGQVREV